MSTNLSFTFSSSIFSGTESKEKETYCSSQTFYLYQYQHKNRYMHMIGLSKGVVNVAAVIWIAVRGLPVEIFII